MNKIVITILFCCLETLSVDCIAQSKIVSPDLSNKGKLKAYSRNITLLSNDKSKAVIHMDSKPGAGVVWINDLNFKTGVIEFDVKGKDVLQESFVGIAFHGLNDTTYEAVYFRPFNFQSADPVRKKHSVQYISLPKFDWYYLREVYPDKYENTLTSDVDPNDWFHVKIIVDRDSVKAFVNSGNEPCLSVQPLTNNTMGKIGFWVGNGSDGDFANLVLRNN